MNLMGKNIRYFRELNKLTQQQLAEKLNISDKTISSWEIGRSEPKMGMIEKMSKIFGCYKTDFVEENVDNVIKIRYRLNSIMELILELSDDEIQKVFDYVLLISKSKNNN